MTREDYLIAQALVLAMEVLSNQPGALRPDNNIREMKGLPRSARGAVKLDGAPSIASERADRSPYCESVLR